MVTQFSHLTMCSEFGKYNHEICKERETVDLEEDKKKKIHGFVDQEVQGTHVKTQCP